MTAGLLADFAIAGTKYTAIAIHGDEDANKKHGDLGFHDGSGKALDQLAATREEDVSARLGCARVRFCRGKRAHPAGRTATSGIRLRPEYRIRGSRPSYLPEGAVDQSDRAQEGRVKSLGPGPDGPRCVGPGPACSSVRWRLSLILVKI